MDPAIHFAYALPMKGYSRKDCPLFYYNHTEYGSTQSDSNRPRSEFHVQRLKLVTDMFASTRIRTSPYHPESNGSLEGFHSTVEKVLCEQKGLARNSTLLSEKYATQNFWLLHLSYGIAN